MQTKKREDLKKYKYTLMITINKENPTIKRALCSDPKQKLKVTKSKVTNKYFDYEMKFRWQDRINNWESSWWIGNLTERDVKTSRIKWTFVKCV